MSGTIIVLFSVHALDLVYIIAHSILCNHLPAHAAGGNSIALLHHYWLHRILYFYSGRHTVAGGAHLRIRLYVSITNFS